MKILATICLAGFCQLTFAAWWMGCKRDQQFARDTVAAATSAADLRAKMWA